MGSNKSNLHFPKGVKKSNRLFGHEETKVVVSATPDCTCLSKSVVESLEKSELESLLVNFGMRKSELLLKRKKTLQKLVLKLQKETCPVHKKK